MRLHFVRHSLQHSQGRQETRAPTKNIPRARAWRPVYHLPSDKRIEAARQDFRPRRIGIFPAKYSANVHHSFCKNRCAAWARPEASGDAAGRNFRESSSMTSGRTRVEKDSMGQMSVPESALYGASTERAVLNFPISGYRFSRPFIRALGMIKWAAAQANHDLGLLYAERSALIVQAAEEVVDGKLDEHFPLDIFQTGSGTSTNTNANEVIANRCAQLGGKPIDRKSVV